jgi:hypothetical protein
MRGALVCSGVDEQRLAAEELVGDGSVVDLARVSEMKKLRRGSGVYIGAEEDQTDLGSRWNSKFESIRVWR